PKVSPSRLLQSLKGATARQANLLLGRTGETFWQAESYDHWVRNEREFQRIAAYIEENPVSAGLAATPEDWRWSSVCGEAPRHAAVPARVVDEAVQHGWPAELFTEVIGSLPELERSAQPPVENRANL